MTNIQCDLINDTFRSMIKLMFQYIQKPNHLLKEMYKYWTYLLNGKDVVESNRLDISCPPPPCYFQIMFVQPPPPPTPTPSWHLQIMASPPPPPPLKSTNIYYKNYVSKDLICSMWHCKISCLTKDNMVILCKWQGRDNIFYVTRKT